MCPSHDPEKQGALRRRHNAGRRSRERAFYLFGGGVRNRAEVLHVEHAFAHVDHFVAELVVRRAHLRKRRRVDLYARERHVHATTAHAKRPTDPPVLGAQIIRTARCKFIYNAYNPRPSARALTSPMAVLFAWIVSKRSRCFFRMPSRYCVLCPFISTGPSSSSSAFLLFLRDDMASIVVVHRDAREA